jgi:hypothetical protein
LTVQPLTVATLSEIKPRDLAQASALSTVNRAVASSLGIAILATLVQTQTQVHFGHLAEMVTANSPIAHFIPAIQAFFVSQGSDLFSAHQAALQLIARFVQREAFVLAIQDAFRLTIVIIAVALIATFFVRGTRRQRNVPQQNGPQEKQSPVPPEAKAAGEPDEAEHFVAVEI